VERQADGDLDDVVPPPFDSRGGEQAHLAEMTTQ
jgi:hypothetical protein